MNEKKQKMEQYKRSYVKQEDKKTSTILLTNEILFILFDTTIITSHFSQHFHLLAHSSFIYLFPLTIKSENKKRR